MGCIRSTHTCFQAPTRLPYILFFPNWNIQFRDQHNNAINNIIFGSLPVTASHKPLSSVQMEIYFRCTTKMKTVKIYDIIYGFNQRLEVE